MKRIRCILAAIAVLALLSSCLALPASAVDSKAYAKEVVRLVNIERKKLGLNELDSSMSALNNAAYKRAQEIVTAFEHKRPDGSSCFTVMDDYSIASIGRGENIAMGYKDPAVVMKDWMNSKGHRDNILGKYNKIGIGVYEKGGVVYCVQLFIREQGAAAKGYPFWTAWPDVVQLILYYVCFGWIWMQ